jgi:hypothetical protein
MWAGWVHNSWRFGRAEAFREVGPEMPELGSKTSTIQSNKHLVQFFSFGELRMISCRDWWQWTESGYITMEWRHRSSPGLNKNPTVKFGFKIYRFDFFGPKQYPPHWLSSKRPNYQPGILLISAGTIEGHFVGKNAAGISPRRSVLAQQCPSHRHLQTVTNWPTCTSNAVITHSILRILPRRTTTCFLDWKNNWNVSIFPPTRGSMLPRKPGWSDNILNFFNGLQMLQQMAKKCIGLRGEFAE